MNLKKNINYYRRKIDMLEKDVVLNKSKTYLLYYIKEALKLSFCNKIVNTYLFLNGEPKIAILYKFDGSKIFCKYERDLECSEWYCETIDVSKKLVLYVFEVPESFGDVYKLFCDGKYSKLPDKEKMIFFLKEQFRITEESNIIKVIRKDSGLKQKIEEELGVLIGDLDLSSAPCLENENFKLKIEDG